MGPRRFFVGAVWAAVRLLQRDALRDYLLAGGLVGVAAACKYPGALAGVWVVAAHLIMRRAFFDRRLWLAGLTAVAVFALLSPYVLLDFDTFATHLLSQAGQLERGRGGDLGRGWWYHLHFSLAVNGGWLALGLLGLGVVETLRRRHAVGWVVLAAFLGYYAVMGSGQTVFARYALPLMALGLALVLAQPLYASWRQLSLLGRVDTRVQARAWIEAHVPAGAVLGNFGGWAGDVPLRSFEGLRWEVSHFERVFGREQMDRALVFLEELGAPVPFYGYALQRTNIAQAAGSMAEIERLETTWVALHRHPLGYSRIDSTFAGELRTRAERVAHFVPQGLWGEGADYDMLDAFYLPLAGFGTLERPGPEIEIWRMRGYPVGSGLEWESRSVFARAYVAGASSALGKKALDEADALARRALELDGESVDAWYALAMVRQLAGNLSEAESFYRKRLNLQDPMGAGVAMHNLGVIHERRGATEEAEEA